MLLFQDKIFIIQQRFPVTILYENPKWLCIAMQFIIPMKIWSNDHLDLQTGSCYRLNKCRDFYSWELMDELVQIFP